jgi:hypothetical protein
MRSLPRVWPEPANAIPENTMTAQCLFEVIAWLEAKTNRRFLPWIEEASYPWSGSNWIIEDAQETNVCLRVCGDFGVLVACSWMLSDVTPRELVAGAWTTVDINPTLGPAVQTPRLEVVIENWKRIQELARRGRGL